MLPHITHVIFDLDGTLLDSEGLYSEAAQLVCEPYGKVYTRELKQRCMGGQALRGAEIVVEALSLPLTPAEYLAAREQHLLRLMADVQPMPGAHALVARLLERRVPMAIATSSHRDLTHDKLAGHDFLRTVSCIICGDDARLEQPKPAPDIFLLAAAELDADPDQCAVIEDSVQGVMGALAAGMRTVALIDPRFSPDPALFAGAHAQVASLEAVRLNHLGIPE